MIPITVIVLTLNEEKSLPPCLASVAEFDEIFVVDSFSTDRTRAIAAAAGANLVEFRWNGTYPKKKQWSLDHVARRNRYVLMLDADERVTPTLLAELRRLTLDDFSPAAFDVQLDYVFLGRQLRHGHKVRKRVVLDPSRCRFEEVDDLQVGTMWEVEGHYQPTTADKVPRLRGRLLHDDRDPLFDYFARHNRYSDWEAAIRRQPSLRVGVRRKRTQGGRIFERLPGKPVAFFIFAYFFRLGFLDGYPGFAHAMAQMFYYWQIDWKVRDVHSGVSTT